MRTDYVGDAWASRANNRLRAEKFKRRIFADMEQLCGKTGRHGRQNRTPIAACGVIGVKPGRV
jgi:hypothetical protein